MLAKLLGLLACVALVLAQDGCDSGAYSQSTTAMYGILQLNEFEALDYTQFTNQLNEGVENDIGSNPIIYGIQSGNLKSFCSLRAFNDTRVILNPTDNKRFDGNAYLQPLMASTALTVEGIFLEDFSVCPIRHPFFCVSECSILLWRNLNDGLNTFNVYMAMYPTGDVLVSYAGLPATMTGAIAEFNSTIVESDTMRTVSTPDGDSSFINVLQSSATERCNAQDLNSCPLAGGIDSSSSFRGGTIELRQLNPVKNGTFRVQANIYTSWQSDHLPGTQDLATMSINILDLGVDLKQELTKAATQIPFEEHTNINDFTETNAAGIGALLPSMDQTYTTPDTNGEHCTAFKVSTYLKTVVFTLNKDKNDLNADKTIGVQFAGRTRRPNLVSDITYNGESGDFIMNAVLRLAGDLEGVQSDGRLPRTDSMYVPPLVFLSYQTFATVPDTFYFTFTSETVKFAGYSGTPSGQSSTVIDTSELGGLPPADGYATVIPDQNTYSFVVNPEVQLANTEDLTLTWRFTAPFLLGETFMPDFLNRQVQYSIVRKDSSSGNILSIIPLDFSVVNRGDCLGAYSQPICSQTDLASTLSNCTASATGLECTNVTSYHNLNSGFCGDALQAYYLNVADNNALSPDAPFNDTINYPQQEGKVDPMYTDENFQLFPVPVTLINPTPEVHGLQYLSTIAINSHNANRGYMYCSRRFVSPCTTAGMPSIVADDGNCTSDNPDICIDKYINLEIDPAAHRGDGIYILSIPSNPEIPSIELNYPSATNATSLPLKQGIYNVLVTDPYGCVMEDTVDLFPKNSFANETLLSSVSVTNGSCFEESTVTVTYNVPSSSGTLTIDVILFASDGTNVTDSTGAGTFTFTEVAPGDYVVHVVHNIDGSVHHTLISEAFSVGGPTAPLSGDITGVFSRAPYVVESTCSDTQDAVLKAEASGGVPPYTFQWFDVDSEILLATGETYNESTITVPPSVPYNVTLSVIDDNSCVFNTTYSVMIDSGIDLTMTASGTPPTCKDGSDGIIEFTIPPFVGTAPIFEWFEPCNPSSIGCVSCTNVEGETTCDTNKFSHGKNKTCNARNDARAGLYRVVARSQSGCVKAATFSLDDSASPVSPNCPETDRPGSTCYLRTQ